MRSRARPLALGPASAISPAIRPVTPMIVKPAKNERLDTIVGRYSPPSAPPPWPTPSHRAKPLLGPGPSHPTLFLHDAGLLQR